MFMGAMPAFSVAVATGNPWLGMLAAMLAAGLLALLHGIVTIHLEADQVVSGLALTFLGTGIALVLGRGPEQGRPGSLLPTLTVPVLSAIPLIGPIFFTNQSVLVYVGYLLVPAGLVLDQPHPAGLHLRAVGENPAAADTLGVNVYRLRYAYVIVGGMLAGLAGATISLAIRRAGSRTARPAAQGWIAIGLVIFAQWDPCGRCSARTLRRAAPPDPRHPGAVHLLRHRQPVLQPTTYLTFFLQMLPYAFTIVVLIIGSREAMRRRLGAPAALGLPYVRGERGS